MSEYRTKINKLPGTHWRQVLPKALFIYKQIKRKSRRRPYVRSAYFSKDKIFLELFWLHLYDSANLADKIRRVKYFSCAIELIQYTRLHPTSKENPNKRQEILHRFSGITPAGDRFYVQIKVNKRTGQKWFMSVFPAK